MIRASFSAAAAVWTVLAFGTSCALAQDDLDADQSPEPRAEASKESETDVTSDTVVYVQDFEGSSPDLSRWSSSKVSHTPAANYGFLGEFSNEKVTLKLSSLPPHTQIRVAFEVYAIRAWDGNSAPGPDRWGMDVSDAVRTYHLIDTTFAVSRVGLVKPQAYPDPWPAGDNPQRTGARQNNILGYQWRGEPLDSIYQIEVVAPHYSPNVTIDFWASGLQEIEDESWGIDNVTVIAEGDYADCDESGSFDIFDILCYLNKFNRKDPFADCDGNGKFDNADVLCYLNKVSAPSEMARMLGIDVGESAKPEPGEEEAGSSSTAE